MRISLKIKIEIILAGFIVLMASFFLVERSLSAETDQSDNQKSLLELNIEIEKKRKEIEGLQDQTKTYQNNIKSMQSQAVSLSTQISIFEDDIASTETAVEIAKIEIEKLGLEIENVRLRIKSKEAEISVQKERIGELINQINKADQKSYLEITLGHDRFSDFFTHLKFLKEIESQNKDLLDRYKQLKIDLEQQETAGLEKKNALDDKKVELEQTKEELNYQVVYKEDLLDQTRSSEEKFGEILEDLRAEQNAINSELASLEKVAREKLELDDREFDLGDGSRVLSWPVSPAGGITAYFHDPSYPFRWIFEHPAIDIRASQGTPVAAAADGYVIRAKDAGRGYSYVMLAHGNDLTTVYGHISQIYIQEDSFIERGSIIGLSGGQPGTNGAGSLTTGAHLHFEVRINGIPVNPLNYLP